MNCISVVIPTYNRRDTLAQNLARLAAQTLDSDAFEVIIIDDGSDDGTGDMVEALTGTLPFELRYFHHANRGPGYTQNRGIRAAEHSLVLLLADDALATPGLLEEHLRLHQLHPEPQVAVAGKMQQSSELPDTPFLRHWDPWDNRDLEPFEELEYIYFWGCNLSFKRSLLMEHGLFLERKGAAMEDVELGFRLACKAGMRLLYGKQALCYHQHPETIESTCTRAFERGCNFDLLTDNVTDPLLYARLRLLGQPAYQPPSTGVGPCDRLYGSDRAAERETWRLQPWRRAMYQLLFNSPTVHALWLPLIRAAHRYRVFEPLVDKRVINGTVLYFLNAGIRELHRQRQRNRSTAAAGQ